MGKCSKLLVNVLQGKSTVALIFSTIFYVFIIFMVATKRKYFFFCKFKYNCDYHTIFYSFVRSDFRVSLCFKNLKELFFKHHASVWGDMRLIFKCSVNKY